MMGKMESSIIVKQIANYRMDEGQGYFLPILSINVVLRG